MDLLFLWTWNINRWNIATGMCVAWYVEASVTRCETFQPWKNATIYGFWDLCGVSMAMHFPPSDAALFHGLLNFVSTKIARKLLSLLLSHGRQVSSFYCHQRTSWKLCNWLVKVFRQILGVFANTVVSLTTVNCNYIFIWKLVRLSSITSVQKLKQVV